jgi:hypothetical protein
MMAILPSLNASILLVDVKTVSFISIRIRFVV